MKILLGVSGSISAYKAFDLTRSFKKRGHEVKVVLTNGALKFVVPEVFTYLGASDVYKASDDFLHKNVLHVDLARWCDLLLLAPASANTLSRMAQGQASDLLSCVFLALGKDKNILIFPAMNSQMLAHPFTEENINSIKKLKTLKNIFISPTDSGVLVCEEIGLGKLPSPEEIVELSLTIKKILSPEKQKNILITTGATIAPLDPVRFLTNSSSGLTGFHLAHTALSMGHKVTVIAGAKATEKLDLLLKHPHFKLIRIKTVEEMEKSVHLEIENSDLYISAAAISDIQFDHSVEKIKKEALHGVLKIKHAPDILKSVIEKKKHSLKIVGFAAETDLSDFFLNNKFQKKPVDLLIGTKVHNGFMEKKTTLGFDNEFADYRILSPEGYIFEGRLTKAELAQKILHSFFPASAND